MARYIDADALIEKIREKFKYNWEIPCTSEDRFIQEIVCKVYDLIYKQPIADVVEVKQGKWEKRKFIIFDSVKVGYNCSECNTTWDTGTPYCPNCGAKMDGERKCDK